LSTLSLTIMADQRNLVDVEELLEKLRSNDSSLTKVNLNSYQAKKGDDMVEPTVENAIAIAQAIANNTHLLELQLSNAHVNTEAAKEFAKALETNNTLTTLNLETNDIAGDGIVAIVESLRKNDTLTELKLTNQLKIIPSDVERSLAGIIEGNNSLQKFVVSLREQSSRNAVDKIIFRNKELARKKRVDAKRAAESGK